MRDESMSHTGAARLYLSQHPEKPKAGSHPTDAYLGALGEVKRMEARRRVFRQKVEAKLADVATLLGSSRLADSLIVGDLVVKLHDIVYLIETGNAETARRMVDGLAEALLKDD